MMYCGDVSDGKAVPFKADIVPSPTTAFVAVTRSDFTFTQHYFRHKQINQKRSKSSPDP